ncbi:Aminopeptidase N [Planctomycetes bacterium Poly30]|uniref:Aminopeptidase N n=1 Tax=Saltatorellus ferox TaxID=2528018 RepID=A0A518ENZ8_9BACT|nr:Aminopeptidase N [Planctomycetes bacterium Poly30]
MTHRSFAHVLLGGFATLLLGSCQGIDPASDPAPAPSDASVETSAAQDFTEQERLRGSITPERKWWDVQHYGLTLEVMPDTKSLEGSNVISFRTLKKGDRMQIDLQPPLEITRIVHRGEELRFERNGNVYWADFAEAIPAGQDEEVEVFYEGEPQESLRPPWSGGFTWGRDSKGGPFIATTCQGLGASVWWPNKDHGYDEPDRGVDVRVTVPEDLVAVSNGRLKDQSRDAEAKTRSFHWQVTNPINNYCVNLNIGHYMPISSTYEGKGGTLDVQYWVLEHQEEKARKQFQEVPRTLEAFEHWFGQYPFYEDSYKLVVVPYLGMEHQSSVTYGNGFENGYRGRDLSETGVGLKFDFIIVHESAHEWWGNNVSMDDVADMWIHESFANYAENLFVDYHFSKEEAEDYVIGCRKLIKNDVPIIGTYGLNRSGSGDMYYKGGNMLHTMRSIVNDDERWRRVLRGINEEFWHDTVKTEDFEAYISRETGFDFGPFFDQYLRTTKIPVLAYEGVDGGVRLWWKNVVPGFKVPVDVRLNGAEQRVIVSTKPTPIALGGPLESLELDRNFYMDVEEQGAD